MTVVDASVVVDWVAPGVDRSGPSGRFLEQLARSGTTVVAPRLLYEEVANALLAGVRRRRWTGLAADQSYELLRRLPVETVDDVRDRDRAWELSRRYDDHPLHDMVYVALAQRLGDRLVTQDGRLRERVTMLDFVIGP